MPIILQSLNDVTGEISATASNICAEALRKAGYSSSSTQWDALLNRAETSWLEEVKSDIAHIERRLSTLKVSVDVTGQDTYTFPSDYAALGDIWVLNSDGTLDYKISLGWESNTTIARTLNVSDYSTKSIRINYFIDLTLVALDSGYLDALYRKYRNTFVYGVFVKALENKNDTRDTAKDQIYFNYVKLLVGAERMGAETDGDVPLLMRVVE